MKLTDPTTTHIAARLEQVLAPIVDTVIDDPIHLEDIPVYDVDVAPPPWQPWLDADTVRVWAYTPDGSAVTVSARISCHPGRHAQVAWSTSVDPVDPVDAADPDAGPVWVTAAGEASVTCTTAGLGSVALGITWSTDADLILHGEPAVILAALEDAAECVRRELAVSVRA